MFQKYTMFNKCNFVPHKYKIQVFSLHNFQEEMCKVQEEIHKFQEEIRK